MPNRRRPLRERAPRNRAEFTLNSELRRRLHDRYTGPTILHMARRWAYSYAVFKLKNAKPELDNQPLNAFLNKPLALEALLDHKDRTHPTVVKILRSRLHIRGEKDFVTERRVKAFMEEFQKGFNYLRRGDSRAHT